MTMAWTAWRLLAEKSQWFDDNFDYNGAACYELSIGALVVETDALSTADTQETKSSE